MKLGGMSASLQVVRTQPEVTATQPHFLSMNPYHTHLTPVSRLSALVSHSHPNPLLHRVLFVEEGGASAYLQQE